MKTTSVSFALFLHTLLSCYFARATDLPLAVRNAFADSLQVFTPPASESFSLHPKNAASKEKLISVSPTKADGSTFTRYTFLHVRTENVNGAALLVCTNVFKVYQPVAYANASRPVLVDREAFIDSFQKILLKKFPRTTLIVNVECFDSLYSSKEEASEAMNILKTNSKMNNQAEKIEIVQL